MIPPYCPKCQADRIGVQEGAIYYKCGSIYRQRFTQGVEGGALVMLGIETECPRTGQR